MCLTIPATITYYAPMNRNTQMAPRTESYLPEPRFRFAPNQREIDFAQIVAAGGDMVEALSLSSLVTPEEAQAATRSQLYAMGVRLLSSPAVQERIDYYLRLHKASMNVSVERIQQELAAVSFSDFAHLFHPTDGPLQPDPFDPEGPHIPAYRAGDPIRNPHDLPRHLRAAIKEWRIDKDGCLVVKMHDKLKGVQLLGDLQGYFAEADRAKAPQISISIGDGQGLAPARRASIEDAQIVEPDPLPDCLQ